MAQAHKICPICGSPAHHNAVVCTTCGTTLTDVQPTGGSTRPRRPSQTRDSYDYRYGETDLYEEALKRRSEVALFGGVFVLALVICGLIGVAIGSRFFAAVGSVTETLSPSPLPSAGVLVAETFTPFILATNTPRPLPNFVTVTPAPTATPEPTQCVRVVQPGDTLYAIAAACGHRDAAVLDVIVSENGLASADALAVGQSIVVPAPTPTVDPNAPTLAPASTEAANETDGEGVAQASAPTRDPLVFPTETLQPGVAWHTVSSNETMISIAIKYGANAEILSQLNPQVPFLQCDFRFDSGGESCIVQLFIGQQLRVPAPTPTATIPPTASGSETPTPSPTPTFNAPSALSPGDRALFRQDELITLRWVPTGTLGENQVYRVRITDLTSGLVYGSDTRELYFIVPQAWQGTGERRHEYEWTVSVINLDSPDVPIFTTTPRIFVWESR
jgi:LysM repeat protein